MSCADRADAPTRVLLIDDHAIVRRGLRSILELEPDITVVGEVDGQVGALESIEKLEPDVILLDLQLSRDHDAEGLDLCREILEHRPESRVVILSTFLDEDLLNQSLCRGAAAYVLKEVDVVELMRIIRAVADGGSAFDSRSAALVRRLVTHGTGKRDDDAEPDFTERERQVIGLLAAGLTNREIGSRLFVSESTAKFHVHNVMRKLRVRRRAEVAYAAGRRGLSERRASR